MADTAVDLTAVEQDEQCIDCGHPIVEIHTVYLSRLGVKTGGVYRGCVTCDIGDG